MSTDKSFHSICRWTFHAGKGGFLPANMRPAWGSEKFGTVEMIQLVKDEIANRIPNHIELGIELHYDNEVNEENATEVARALKDTGLHLAMITPGAHGHFGYGGIASLDRKERTAADEFGVRTVDLAYGALRSAWHPSAELAPTFVLWNGSFGYDLASIGIREMYQNLKKSIAALCEYEQKIGGELYFGLEPKPNEGHPAMLIPTVASALIFWRRVHDEFGIPREKKGVNMEFGHSEMIGLDHVYDTVEQLDDNAMTHIHLNSQGYNDGMIYGGPGKYDIDHGTRINGMNIAVARLMQDANYRRWRGHDMQVRPYDNESQAVERVIRSILSWEACERVASNMNSQELLQLLSDRETAKAEDLVMDSVLDAHAWFREQYQASS